MKIRKNTIKLILNWETYWSGQLPGYSHSLKFRVYHPAKSTGKSALLSRMNKTPSRLECQALLASMNATPGWLACQALLSYMNRTVRAYFTVNILKNKVLGALNLPSRESIRSTNASSLMLTQWSYIFGFFTLDRQRDWAVSPASWDLHENFGLLTSYLPYR